MTVSRPLTRPHLELLGDVVAPGARSLAIATHLDFDDHFRTGPGLDHQLADREVDSNGLIGAHGSARFESPDQAIGEGGGGGGDDGREGGENQHAERSGCADDGLDQGHGDLLEFYKATTARRRSGFQ